MKFYLLNLFLLLNLTLTSQTPQLWGMTNGGGNFGEGTLFKINGDGSGFALRNSFNDVNGGFSRSSLIRASNNMLYGMTYSGGSNFIGYGVLFRYDPFNLVDSVLFSFSGTDGENPQGNVILASNNKLYGMTSLGGLHGNGVLFSYDLSANIYSVEYDFDSLNGKIPYGSLVQASDGNLYGMTYSGGVYGFGVIFSFNPSNNSFLKLFDFNDTLGKLPVGSLMQANDGKLYGLTPVGGAYGSGVIFSFNPSNNSYLKLYDFSSSTGQTPLGNFIQAGNGKLYGTTCYGGTNGYGVIFSFDPLSSVYADLRNFYSSTGANPLGSFIEASDGKLYGMTRAGGLNNYGTIFKFDFSNNTYTKFYDFSMSSGFGSWGDLIELNPAINNINSLPVKNVFSVFPNPSEGNFQLTGNFPVKTQLHIFNLLGEEVTEPISIPDGNNSVQVDLNLADGIYSYRIVSGDEILHEEKLVIVR